MPALAPPGPIALYGATGFTGRLVARELKQRGLEMVLSGRNADKLAALSDELGGGVATQAASTGDPASLARLLDRCSAVINCAGPFSEIGEPVVAAAIATRTHYADTTGEQLYINRIFSAYGARARAAGVAVVPAIGFDFLPGDLLANLTGAGMGKLDNMTLAYYVTGMQATHGTLLSALEIMRTGRLVYENGYLRAAPGRFAVHEFAFPSPIGPKPMVDYPSGEIMTVPRHTPTRKMTSLLSASAIGPAAATAALPAITAVTSLLTRTPAIRLMRAGVRRLPEGPTDAQRDEAKFTIVAEAVAGDETRTGVLSGSDVYGITGVIAAEAAQRMIDPGFDRSGVLAPAEAWDAASFLDALTDHGIAYEASPVAPVAV